MRFWRDRWVGRGEYDRIQRLYADTLTREYSAMSRTARAEKQYDTLLEKYHCLVDSLSRPVAGPMTITTPGYPPLVVSPEVVAKMEMRE